MLNYVLNIYIVVLSFFYFFRSLCYFVCSNAITYSLRYCIKKSILKKVLHSFKLRKLFCTYVLFTFVADIFFNMRYIPNFVIFSHVPLSILQQMQLINKLPSFLNFSFHLTYTNKRLSTKL